MAYVYIERKQFGILYRINPDFIEQKRRDIVSNKGNQRYIAFFMLFEV